MISKVFVYVGGPHAHFAAEWNATAAALTKLGFAVLMGECRDRRIYGHCYLVWYSLKRQSKYSIRLLSEWNGSN